MEGVSLPEDDNYNHFLCIYIPYLHMFLEDRNLINSNYPVYYNGPYVDILKKYTNNIVKNCEIPKDIPILNYHPRTLDADLSLKVREKLIQDYESEKSNDVIFIKRKNRNLKNINEIIFCIQSFGLNVNEIDFSELSFDEQIKISNESKIMIGVHGAGLTNLMFMKKNSFVVEIDPFDWGFNCYEHLASNLGMKNFKRICFPTTKDKYISEFEIDIKNFKENIKYLV
jgi:capsular polysaccharide biosynthesis protein